MEKEIDMPLAPRERTRETQARHITAVKWAISVAQLDVEHLRAGDWVNLQEDLYEFIHGDYRLLPGAAVRQFIESNADKTKYWKKMIKESFCKKITRSIVQKIQARFYEVLSHLTYGASMSWCEGGKDAGFIFYANSESPFEWDVRSADPLRSAPIALGAHLVGSGVTMRQLRICPDCQTMFLLTRRPRKDRHFHCSTRCARNAATKHYRERLKERSNKLVKSKERERSQKRYRDKVHQKWPNARIQKKPHGKHVPEVSWINGRSEPKTS
jgi:hypothetical protein